MSTLHADAIIRSYSNDCRLIHTMWGAWQQPQRQSAFALVHRSLCQKVGIPHPPITFEQSNDCGSFGWGTWSITVGNKLFGQNLTKDQFIELCCTVYHETRHAEQFYRVAQGLILGRHEFPANLPAVGSLKQKISLAMSIRADIVQHAETHKNTYDTFAKSDRQPHCTAGSGPGWSNWDPTVSDWLERTYSKSKQTFAVKGQNAAVGTAQDKAWYKGAEDERDAYAIEDRVKLALTPML